MPNLCLICKPVWMLLFSRLAIYQEAKNEGQVGMSADAVAAAAVATYNVDNNDNFNCDILLSQRFPLI